MYVAHIPLTKREQHTKRLQLSVSSYFNSLSLRCSHKQGRGRGSEKRPAASILALSTSPSF